MINKFLYPRGGADIYMLKLGARLSELGHTVEYFGMADPQNTVTNSWGEYTRNMDFRGKSLDRFAYPFRIIYSGEAKARLRKVLWLFRPDVVHMNNINFQLTPSVIDACHDAGVPVIQTVHDFQIICPNHMLYNLQEQAICERCVRGSKWNCARYKCIHESLVKSIIGSLEAQLYLKKDTYRKVYRYICPSRFMEKMLLEGRPDLAGKTCAIHNFIELPDADDGAKEPYVVMACRLSQEKGIAAVREAALKLPHVRFKIAGSGPEEDLLKGLPNVELMGFMSGKPLLSLIGRAACMLVPSIWYENCPLTILEAHSLGTPVITAGFGGMAELVEDGVTGKHIDPVTGDTLAAAIDELMSDPDRLAAMARSCREKRESMITIDKYLDMLLDIFREAMEGKA
ncbi:MAG: glycosyltransferase [Abditibacteriota bacterium]|nr:glycosyltransferase [Abditibacteriota bacterium]